MSWTSAPKTISIASHNSHIHPHPVAVTALLKNTTFSFSPLRLFGAAARCSHLHVINPNIDTPERAMIEKLIEPHVSNVKGDFAVLATANQMKDFVQSYFTGTVAAGIAYLAMVANGYFWFDHFENAGGGNPRSASTPDFVFAGIQGVALMESKGTRRDTKASFNRFLSKEYNRQVAPHIGHNVGGAVPTHGYCIGSHMTSNVKAELLIHHTRAIPKFNSLRIPPALVGVQRNNFATAFSLVGDQSLDAMLRSGSLPDTNIEFFQFEWSQRFWITRRPPTGWLVGDRPFTLLRSIWPFYFAIEKGIAEEALKSFLGSDPRSESSKVLSPLDMYSGDERDSSAVVFPDGLAVFRMIDFKEYSMTTFSPWEFQFVD